MFKLANVILISFFITGCAPSPPTLFVHPGVYCVHGDSDYKVVVMRSNGRGKQYVTFPNGKGRYVDPSTLRTCP